jgi:hypothetical protein
VLVEDLTAQGAIPESVTITFAGATAQMNEAFGGLFFSMGVAILAVYIVMVLALGSLVTPFIILFSLPLALIGAIPALLISGNPLGISAMIGFLMLIGIVVTNAIVLLTSWTAAGRRAQRGAHRAPTRAVAHLMTAVATILALSPGRRAGPGSIIAAELATVVIGGLSLTFLTSSSSRSSIRSWTAPGRACRASCVAKEGEAAGRRRRPRARWRSGRLGRWAHGDGVDGRPYGASGAPGGRLRPFIHRQRGHLPEGARIPSGRARLRTTRRDRSDEPSLTWPDLRRPPRRALRL